MVREHCSNTLCIVPIVRQPDHIERVAVLFTYFFVVSGSAARVRSPHFCYQCLPMHISVYIHRATHKRPKLELPRTSVRGT